MDAYITQMAIWWYLSGLTDDFIYADETTDKYKLVPVARKLVKTARSISSDTQSKLAARSSKIAKIYSTTDSREARVIGLF